jgi:hypothetical protein
MKYSTVFTCINFLRHQFDTYTIVHSTKRILTEVSVPHALLYNQDIFLQHELFTKSLMADTFVALPNVCRRYVWCTFTTIITTFSILIK